MQVLNVGHAKLAGKVRIEGLDQLGALILNDNQITAVSGKARLCSAKNARFGSMGRMLCG